MRDKTLGAYHTSAVALFQPQTTVEMPREELVYFLKNRVRIFQMGAGRRLLFIKGSHQNLLSGYQAPSSISVLIVFTVVKTRQW